MELGFYDDNSRKGIHEIPLMEEWRMEWVELAEMVKLIVLKKKKRLANFVFTWKSLFEFLQENERNEKLILGFDE